MTTGLDEIQKFIENNINNILADHGGSALALNFVDGKVYVTLQGGCQGCAGARMTLRLGIERALVEEFEDVKEIVDVTDHTSGTNPYFVRGDNDD